MDEHIVYMHVNKVNQKKYVGITHCKNPNRRWMNGRGYMNNPHFAKAISKFGWDNFEHIIIAKGLSKEEACAIEKMIIQTNRTQDRKFGYNITDGGEFFTHSEESKQRMRENRKGKGLHEFSEEHKRKMRENHAGGADKKKVICCETGMIFESINEAARYIGKNKKVISNCCRKISHYNTAGGYHWEFV